MIDANPRAPMTGRPAPARLARRLAPSRRGLAASAAVLALPLWLFAQQPTAPSGPEARWYKGNTHTHTLNSDGDSTPDEVVRWYREHRYQFLVLTDHNYRTPVDGLNAALAAEDRFLLIPGEELTDRSGEKPVHLNAINVGASIQPQGGATVAEVLGRSLEAIRAAGALAQVNHPNFGWALSAADLQRAGAIPLLEIFNGHPAVNNLGGGGLPGAEEIWDGLLTAGSTVYGVASDDAHHFKTPWNPGSARPGRGWVVVRAARLSADAIVSGLATGDCYASTGVELEDVQVTASALTVKVKALGTTKHRVHFIGGGGRLLAEVVTSPAAYVFRGDEQYVRAKIIDSNGLMAWTQPVRVKQNSPVGGAHGR